MLVISLVDRHVSHFGTWEDVDFPKVLKNSARPGECAEKSVDLHEVLNFLRCAAEISATNEMLGFGIPSSDQPLPAKTSELETEDGMKNSHATIVPRKMTFQFLQKFTEQTESCKLIQLT